MKLAVTGPITFDNDDAVADLVSAAVERAGALRFRHAITEEGRITGTVESLYPFHFRTLELARKFMDPAYVLTEIGSVDE